MWDNSEEFSELISSLISGKCKSNSLTYKEKYIFLLLENWKPWLNLPEEFFEKSVLVVSVEKSPEKVSVAVKENADQQFSNLQVLKNVVLNDAEGNPLESVFDASLIENSFSISANPEKTVFFKPFPIGDARCLCSQYQLCQSSKKFGKISFYVLCNSKDEGKTLLIGVSANKCVNVSIEGTLSENETFDLNTIRNRHLRGFSFGTSITEESFFMYYNIHQSSTEVRGPLKPANTGLLAVKCFGKNLQSIIQEPTANDSFVVILKAVLGDDCTGAFMKYRELKLIEALNDSLHTGRVSWPLGENEDKPTFGVLERLNKFFKDSFPEFSLQDKQIDESYDLDSLLTICVTKGHTCMDFACNLWSILSGSSSLDELEEAIKFVFSKIKNFSNVLLYGKDEIAGLYSRNPIKFVLNMGIEKLKKDYTFVFTSGPLHLIPLSSMKEVLMKFQSSDIGVKLQWLQKFHTMLELLIMCRSALHLPVMELCKLMRSILLHYNSIPKVEPSHVFQIAVPLSAIKVVLEKYNPVIKQAIFKSTDENYQKHTIVQINQIPEASEMNGKSLDPVSSSSSISKYQVCSAVFVNSNWE